MACTPFHTPSLLFSSPSLHPLRLSFTISLTTSSTSSPTTLSPSIPSPYLPFLSLFSLFLTPHLFLPHSTLLHTHPPPYLLVLVSPLPPSHSSSLSTRVLLSHSIPIDRTLTLKWQLIGCLSKQYQSPVIEREDSKLITKRNNR